MVSKLPSNLPQNARSISEAPLGPEFLRIFSIIARDQPKLLKPGIVAGRQLIKDAVKAGLMHPRSLEELERDDPTN